MHPWSEENKPTTCSTFLIRLSYSITQLHIISSSQQASTYQMIYLRDNLAIVLRRAGATWRNLIWKRKSNKPCVSKHENETEHTFNAFENFPAIYFFSMGGRVEYKIYSRQLFRETCSFLTLVVAHNRKIQYSYSRYLDIARGRENVEMASCHIIEGWDLGILYSWVKT